MKATGPRASTMAKASTRQLEEPSTMGNGKEGVTKALVPSSGLMAASTKESGGTAEKTAKACSEEPTALTMKESGWMASIMGREDW